MKPKYELDQELYVYSRDSNRSSSGVYDRSIPEVITITAKKVKIDGIKITKDDVMYSYEGKDGFQREWCFFESVNDIKKDLYEQLKNRQAEEYEKEKAIIEGIVVVGEEKKKETPKTEDEGIPSNISVHFDQFGKRRHY